MKIALCVLLCAIPVWPEVVVSSNNGFTVREIVEIQAPPDQVYKRIVNNIGDWWNPEHTYSGDAHNLSIEAKPMGCFCEKLPQNGGVRHMEIINVAPGRALVLAGALGPLQSMAVTGSMTISVTPDGAATKLSVSYAVGGYAPTGLNTLAGPVDSVLADQFTRLKNLIERGDPTKK